MAYKPTRRQDLGKGPAPRRKRFQEEFKKTLQDPLNLRGAAKLKKEWLKHTKALKKDQSRYGTTYGKDGKPEDASKRTYRKLPLAKSDKEFPRKSKQKKY